MQLKRKVVTVIGLITKHVVCHNILNVVTNLLIARNYSTELCRKVISANNFSLNCTLSRHIVTAPKIPGAREI